MTFKRAGFSMRPICFADHAGGSGTGKPVPYKGCGGGRDARNGQARSLQGCGGGRDARNGQARSLRGAVVDGTRGTGKPVPYGGLYFAAQKTAQLAAVFLDILANLSIIFIAAYYAVIKRLLPDPQFRRGIMYFSADR